MPIETSRHLVIVWHLLGGRAARYRDLGVDYYISRLDTSRRAHNRVRQLEALGSTVTITQAA
jgi:transposase